MKSMTCIAAAMALASILPVRADDSTFFGQYSAAYQPCLETAKAVRQIQHCNSEEIGRQQAAMSRAFQALLYARPGDRSRLQFDQDRWAELMNTGCEEFSRRQGSLNSMKAQDCFRDSFMRRRL